MFTWLCHRAEMSQPTRGIHLFHGDILIANLTTTEAAPAETYLVDGVSYVVKSYTGPYLESDTGEGWDIQVEPA